MLTVFLIFAPPFAETNRSSLNFGWTPRRAIKTPRGDNNGSLTKAEIKMFSYPPQIQTITWILQGNGYINVSDLRDILRALDENVSEEELDEMIAEIDQDGSGTVDFDGRVPQRKRVDNLNILEFMEMMSGE